MHKRTLMFITSALMVSVLAGCGSTSSQTSTPSNSEDPTTSDGNSTIPSEPDFEVPTATIRFWTGFGGAVNGVLEPMLEDFQEKYPSIDVLYETQGGYDNLKQAIDLSVANQSFPHIANGYPDHFASYINSNIMKPINNYIDNPDYGVDIDDFYQDYLNENQNLFPGVTMGLPFNKSTEIMVANQSFFEVMNYLDNTVKVPETWDELATIGARVKVLAKQEGYFGKIVVEKDGGGYEAVSVDDVGEAKVMFDFTRVTEANFVPFNWDSTDNFFITLVRQWGGVYTEKGDNIREGYIRFDSQAVLDGLTFIKNLGDARILGIPTTHGEALFASTPFKHGKTVLTISSSAGVQENIPDTMDYPFDVSIHPILYRDANHKYVISQGTNLGLFNRRNADEELASWLLLRYLTVERNAEFSRKTSYFPVTKTAQESEEYQNFLNGDTTNYTAKQVSVLGTAITNNDDYMDAEKEWIKFVDPAFVGSSQIRDEVSYIIGKVLQGITPQKAIDEAYGRLGNYIEK